MPHNFFTLFNFFNLKYKWAHIHCCSNYIIVPLRSPIPMLFQFKWASLQNSYKIQLHKILFTFIINLQDQKILNFKKNLMMGQSKWPVAKTKQKKLCDASQLINPNKHKPILQPFYFYLNLIDSIYSSMN